MLRVRSPPHARKKITPKFEIQNIGTATIRSTAARQCDFLCKRRAEMICLVSQYSKIQYANWCYLGNIVINIHEYEN